MRGCWLLLVAGCLSPEAGDPCTVDEDCGEAMFCAEIIAAEGACATVDGGQDGASSRGGDDEDDDDGVTAGNGGHAWW